jgi:hypothetical protein
MCLWGSRLRFDFRNLPNETCPENAVRPEGSLEPSHPRAEWHGGRFHLRLQLQEQPTQGPRHQNRRRRWGHMIDDTIAYPRIREQLKCGGIKTRHVFSYLQVKPAQHLSQFTVAPQVLFLKLFYLSLSFAYQVSEIKCWFMYFFG